MQWIAITCKTKYLSNVRNLVIISILKIVKLFKTFDFNFNILMTKFQKIWNTKYKEFYISSQIYNKKLINVTIQISFRKCNYIR